LNRFANFLAIDWSGAAGERHKGIALALCGPGCGPPERLVLGKPWSRGDVLSYLVDELPPDTLVGLDLGISLPFIDAGAFFPGWEESPADARSLWAFIDDICGDDPHLSAGSLIDHPIGSRYFRRHGGREGDLFNLSGATHRRGRFRLAEEAQAAMGCKPYSNFNLVGAAQVGKSSLTGMRVLHRLEGRIPVWPIDPLPESGSVIVEIYTALAAIAAGRSAARAKITDHAALDDALARLGSQGVAGTGPIDDHTADALVTAAWLRAYAHRTELWRPPGLTPHAARTEGWTFGAV
jgi:hypothetical protein